MTNEVRKLYNYAIETMKGDEDKKYLFEERIAIKTFDGGITEDEAVKQTVLEQYGGKK